MKFFFSKFFYGSTIFHLKKPNVAILKWNLERIRVYVCIHYIFYGRVSTNLTKEPTLKLPDLLKFSRIIFHTLQRTVLNFRACLAGRCLCSKHRNKYSNKPAKGYKRINRRFQVDLATLIFILPLGISIQISVLKICKTMHIVLHDFFKNRILVYYNVLYSQKTCKILLIFLPQSKCRYNCDTCLEDLLLLHFPTFYSAPKSAKRVQFVLPQRQNSKNRRIVSQKK